MEVNGIKIDDSERQYCEIFVRVMGYYQAFQTLSGGSRYNEGKQSEYKDRVFFKEQKNEK